MSVKTWNNFCPANIEASALFVLILQFQAYINIKFWGNFKLR